MNGRKHLKTSVSAVLEIIGATLLNHASQRSSLGQNKTCVEHLIPELTFIIQTF